MAGLKTVPCSIAGVWSGIGLQKEKNVSNSARDQQGMLVKDFIHIALAASVSQITTKSVRRRMQSERTITLPYYTTLSAAFLFS